MKQGIEPWFMAFFVKGLTMLKYIHALASFFLSMFFLGIGCDSKQPTDNPYEYDMGMYQKTDPSLIQCTEKPSMPIPLKQLYGIATSDQIIAITGDRQLLLLDLDGKILRTQELPTIARCVAIDPTGLIYVGTDKAIAVYDQTCQLKAHWPELGPRTYLTSIAIAKDSIFVGDAGNKVVLQYSLDGRIQRRFGEKDDARKIPGLVIYQPHLDVTITKDQQIWITNPGRHSVENYANDGQWKSCWGIASFEIQGFSGCCNPSHIAILENGFFITSEKGLCRIKIYTPDGKFHGVVAGYESLGTGIEPLDIAIDNQQRILVLDSSRKAIRVFVMK